MPQLAIAAAASYIGSAALGTATILGMTGAQIGWMAGSLLGSLLFAPDGPKAQLGDTRAPKIDFGSRMHRVYGTVRVPMSPRWLDEFTATSQSAGGKGGGGGSEFYTYTSNALYWVADGTNVEGFRRIWKNGELVYNNSSTADAATLDASQNSQHWSDITFFDGNPSQMPWSVYEAAVTTPQADAHRRIACIGVQNIECGQGTQLPFFEAEVYTNGTPGDALTLLQSRFRDTDGDSNPDALDESAYQRGAPAQDGGAVVDGAFEVYRDHTANPFTPSKLTYQPSGLVPNGVGALTVECLATWIQTPNVSGTRFLEFVPNVADPGNLHAFDWFSSAGRASYENSGFGTEYTTPVAVSANCHFAIVFSATSTRVYIAGQKVWEGAGSAILASNQMRLIVGDRFGYSSGIANFLVHGFRIRQEEVYTGNSFTPPTEIPPPDGQTVDVLPEDLADVVSAECLRCRGVTAADFDVTDLVGIDVHGFICEGSAREGIEQLMAAYYFTAVPGKKVVFKRLDQASLTTVPAEDTGAGLDQASEMFAGLMRANDLELPAQVSITGPNPSADYDPATATSDRLTTVGNKIEQATWRVVFTPAEMKGRANANALDARIATHTATVPVSDKYAAYEIGDVLTHVDHEGNSYVTRWLRETYSQGVKSVDIRLFDRSILTLTGTMSDTYTPAVVVRGPAEIETALILDTPIFRDADNAYGLYVTATATGRWQGATVYKSADDATWVEVAQLANRGVIGTASELPDFTGWTWDDTSTLTVTLDEGSDTTLSSSTKAAIEADPTINAALVGVHGRWEVINYVTATLVSGTTWTLGGGMLRGQKGTEHNNSTHAAGDKFVLLRTTGIARIEGEATDVGAVRYYKVVPTGATIASVASQSFTTAEQGLKPYAVVDMTAQYSAGNLLVFWNRRSRLSYSPLGSVPLGETSESYVVRVKNGAEVLLEDTVTAPQWTVPPGASLAGLLVEVRQIGVIEGHPGTLILPTYTSAPSGWAAARKNWLTWLGAYGGSTYLFDWPAVTETDYTVYATADGGENYTVAYTGTTKPGLILSQFEPAILSGGEYLSLYLLKYGNAAHQVLGDLDNISAALTSDHHRTLEPWAVFGYPRAISSQALDTAALWSDGTWFYLVGRYADNSQPAGALYLYRAGADGLFTVQGQMVQDPADPNMLPPGVGAFHSQWFTDDTFTRRCGKLFKNGSRWWFTGFHSAYYTDDAAGLTGWLRAPLGMGEAAGGSVALTDMLVVNSADLVVGLKNKYTGDCISVSTDGGATWAASRPASIPASHTMLTLAPLAGAALAYFSPSSGASLLVTSSSDLSTWAAAQTVIGLPSGSPTTYGSFPARLAEDGNLFGITSDGVAIYSADGVTFSIATMP